MRVIDQIQGESGIIAAITKFIQALQATNTSVEYTFASLLVNIGYGIAWQRRYDFYTMFCQELSQAFLARLRQNGEIAAINDMNASLIRIADQLSEMVVHLWCTAGEVQRCHTSGFHDGDDQPQIFFPHHLGTIRAGIDMAVQASLIAAVPQIYLQCVRCITVNVRKICYFQ